MYRAPPFKDLAIEDAKLYELRMFILHVIAARATAALQRRARHLDLARRFAPYPPYDYRYSAAPPPAGWMFQHERDLRPAQVAVAAVF